MAALEDVPPVSGTAPRLNGRASKNGNAAGRRPAMADESGPIMETNGSSIVSKRSVEHKFYDTPHFLRYFVKKRKIRAPLINRGYWLRMQCIEKSILQFCRAANRPSIVINLGAGYDALPFRLLTKDPEAFENTIFVDVDYTELIEIKVKTILSEPNLYKPIGTIDTHSGDGPLKPVAQKYWALGCDLHDLRPLKQLLFESFANGENHAILLVSEVATCYMEPSKVDVLLQEFARYPDVTMCLLEQHLPCGPYHPFAETMLKHFEKLKSPLRGIKQYPTMKQQRNRFKERGWHQVNIESLWQYWCDKLSSSERLHLDEKEPFDEWEEFALYACHYFLLIAKAGWVSRSETDLENDTCHNQKSSKSIWTKPQVDKYATSTLFSRRFGTLYHSAPNYLQYHGGISGSRKSSTITFSPSEAQNANDMAAPVHLEPRMCHTITKLNEDFDLLLVGGRASPERIFSDCWVRLRGKWNRAAPLPIPLYRHSATSVVLSGSRSGVIVYGGRTSGDHTSTECFLWRNGLNCRHHKSDEEESESGRWYRVTVRSSAPIEGRFAASMASLWEKSEGLLLGGLSNSGVPLRNCFTWRLIGQGEGYTIHLEHLDLFNNPTCSMDRIVRFGAVLVSTHNGLALVGGVGANDLIPQDQQIILFRYKDGNYQIENVETSYLSSLLMGHTVAWDGNQVYIVGGGATCFSFGAFNNTFPLSLKADDTLSEARLSFVGSNESSNGQSQPSLPSRGVPNSTNAAPTASRVKDVQILSSVTASQFTDLLDTLHPAILEGLDFGPCTELWTPEHLIDSVGADRSVSVHRASNGFMAFQPGAKNFKYIDCPFGDFISSIYNGEKEYFRALSHANTSTPANLSVDFPALAKEFCLPLPLTFIEDRLHSSVLRISGPVAMWLHYDVLANILVQVRGQKTLILFPPSDVLHLDVPAGSSSSRIDVSELLSGHSSIFERANPHRVVLKPGDALFIPPLWFHCAAPNDNVSVAVNLFFRNMEDGYAAGRDTYGNRDVQAYEEGRRDIAKMVKRLRRLPPAMADFYVQRLSAELREEAAQIARTTSGP